MWNRLRFSVLALLGAAALCAWCAEARAQQDLLVFEQTRIDVGPVPDTAPVTRAFKFTNNSGRLVTLAIGHCHFCPEPQTDKKQYKPGETGIVVLELTTMGKHGDDEATATVGIAGIKDSGVRLTLAGRVRPVVRVEPSGLMLTEVVRARGETHTITITGRKKDFKVERIEPQEPWLSASVGPAQKVEDLGEECTVYDVTLTLKPGLPMGDVQGKMAIYTNDERRERLGFSVEATVVGDLDFRPGHVTIPALKPSSIFTAQFDLSLRSGAPLWPADVELAVDPVVGVSSCVMDVVLGDEPGVLRVTVTGISPDRPRPIFDMPVRARHRSTGETSAAAVRLNVRTDSRAR